MQQELLVDNEFPLNSGFQETRAVNAHSSASWLLVKKEEAIKLKCLHTFSVSLSEKEGGGRTYYSVLKGAIQPATDGSVF